MAEEKWRYCAVCRRNHDEAAKHRYSKQHKSRLTVILSKFSKKVQSARRCLQRPAVVDGELEPGSRLWCYCCEEEVPRHTTDGDVSIEWGGLLQHMTSPAHHKSVRHFWWIHGADKTQLQNFILFKAEYNRFKSLVSEELRKLLDKRERRREKVAVEESSFQRALEPPPQLTFDLPPAARETQPTSNASATVQRGNVHTGATPPWLLGDDDDGQDEVKSKPKAIGPSIDEFIKHREREARKLKNPRRVGADFHLKVASLRDDDDSWLPSFGRVWNHGPRSHSMAEFRQEINHQSPSGRITAPVIGSTPSSHTHQGTTIATSAPSAAAPSSTSSPPEPSTAVKPYVRKRTIH